MKTKTQTEFVKMLRIVAEELKEYAEAIELDPNGEPDWQWSTYAIEAQGALFDLMKQDGLFEEE